MVRAAILLFCVVAVIVIIDASPSLKIIKKIQHLKAKKTFLKRHGRSIHSSTSDDVHDEFLNTNENTRSKFIHDPFIGGPADGVLGVPSGGVLGGQAPKLQRPGVLGQRPLGGSSLHRPVGGQGIGGAVGGSFGISGLRESEASSGSSIIHQESLTSVTQGTQQHELDTVSAGGTGQVRPELF